MGKTLLLLIAATILNVCFINCSTGSDIATKSENQATGSALSIQVSNDIQLKSAPFSTLGLGVYESSNYYPGARTSAGHQMFAQEFQTHNLIRVNAFDWAAVVSDGCVPAGINDYSNCIQAFKQGLESSRGYLTDLTQVNKTKKLMINIFRTPNWLSLNPDSTVACGGGNHGQSYRPKDYSVWQQLLKVTTDFMKEIESGGQGVVIYYEFWNEPDLACNWQEGTPEFLELYSQTMPFIKAQHPNAKVGGAGPVNWKGKIAKDGATKTQNLNFDLIKYVKDQSLVMDYVSFHYFSNNYQGDFVDGVKAYRIYQQQLGISTAQMPVLLTEWLPQNETPYGPNPSLAADAANLFLALQQVNLDTQGGLPWQDYGVEASEQWGIVGFENSSKKPIFYVYKFFDNIARTSLGLYQQREDISVDLTGSSTKYKVGERALLFSKLKTAGCYQMALWNRVAKASDASIAYLFSKGITLEELQNAYGANNELMLQLLISNIRKGQAFDAKWNAEFLQAQQIFSAVEELRASEVFSHTQKFLGFDKFKSVKAQSIARGNTPYQAKVITVKNNQLQFKLNSEEVMTADLCF